MFAAHLDSKHSRPWVQPTARPLRLLILTLAVVLTTFIFLTRPHLTRHWPHDGIITKPLLANLSLPAPPHDPGGPRRLRIFMPADSPHPNLCKSILSALALGYPAPTLLNWRGEFNRPEWHLAGSHIAKLESLLAALDDLVSHNNNPATNNPTTENPPAHLHDLVLLVDAYDIWFQLPPSVLVERFHRLNREADARVRTQWQAANGFATDFPIPPPQQSIIVTSAKDCHPGWDSGADPHYDHWPASPMPDDLYGPDTDTVLALRDPARRFRKVRPRCVNSGLIMGPLGAMRDALRRCVEKVEATARAGRQLWSDQALFGEVMGDQELWREWMRHLGATWNGTAADMSAITPNPSVLAIAAAALRGKRFEFGIGLDYNFTTIPPTCSAEEDGFFVRLDNSSAVQLQSTAAGVPGPARLHGVPADVRRAADLNPSLSAVSWGDEPLYADFFFGSVPVGIHHNAYVNNLKSWRLKNWWSSMWFYPRLRRLVQHNLRRRGPTLMVKVESDDAAAQDLEYWRDDANYVSVFEPAAPGGGGSYRPIDWDGVCQKGSTPWHEELFGDGLGPLTL